MPASADIIIYHYSLAPGDAIVESISIQTMPSQNRGGSLRVTRQSQRLQAAEPAAGPPPPGNPAPTDGAAPAASPVMNSGEADDLIDVSASMAEATLGDAADGSAAGRAPRAAREPGAGAAPGAGMEAHAEAGDVQQPGAWRPQARQCWAPGCPRPGRIGHRRRRGLGLWHWRGRAD